MTTASFAVRGARWERLTQLRELIDIVADLRELKDPLGSVDDFARLIDVAARFAELLGVDSALLDPWIDFLLDKEMIAAVQAVARLVLRLRGQR